MYIILRHPNYKISSLFIILQPCIKNYLYYRRMMYREIKEL